MVVAGLPAGHIDFLKSTVRQTRFGVCLTFLRKTGHKRGWNDEKPSVREAVSNQGGKRGGDVEIWEKIRYNTSISLRDLL